jgi:hypothetical protein
VIIASNVIHGTPPMGIDGKHKMHTNWGSAIVTKPEMINGLRMAHEFGEPGKIPPYL